jgi:hypothetical protein
MDYPKVNTFSCPHITCKRTFKSLGGCTKHWNAIHRDITPATEPDSETKFSSYTHPTLDGESELSSSRLNQLTSPLGIPCNEDGQYLPPFTKPTPIPPPDTSAENPWHPFEDRLAFDWATHHFVELQTSERHINRGLDMWLASTLKSGSKEGIPWQSAREMYATIDAIQQGSAPWRTYSFRYNGPMPSTPPKWMLETYELCTRDSRAVLHAQLSTTDFDGKFDYAPYRQFNSNGDRVWSNLMSGDWAWKQAVCLFWYLHAINLILLRTKLLRINPLTEQRSFPL